MVSQEVGGVDVEPADPSWEREPDDAPVVAGRPPPPRFPAVHPLAPIGEAVGHEHGPLGFEEIFLLGEELVVGEQGRTAEASGGEIEETREGGRFRRGSGMHGPRFANGGSRNPTRQGYGMSGAKVHIPPRGTPRTIRPPDRATQSRA